MSAILYSSQRFEVVLATGEVLVVGAVDNRKTLTLTNGLAYQTHDTIADNYGKDVLWATGQGGLDSFELMLFYSDADVWVEFNDDSGDAADFAVRLCKAGVWYVFPSYRLGINDDTVFDGQCWLRILTTMTFSRLRSAVVSPRAKAMRMSD